MHSFLRLLRAYLVTSLAVGLWGGVYVIVAELGGDVTAVRILLIVAALVTLEMVWRRVEPRERPVVVRPRTGTLIRGSFGYVIQVDSDHPITSSTTSAEPDYDVVLLPDATGNVSGNPTSATFKSLVPST